MTRLEKKHLVEHFKEAVIEARNRLDVEISENTEFYLVDLLSRYTDISTLSEQAIETKTHTFAELYLKSHGETYGKRALILKYIGDTTLFLTGYFSDSFERSLVDIDYYANLGRSSYRDLLDLVAARVIQWKLDEVFDELSAKYIDLMDVIAEVAASDGPRHAGGLLRLYERWLRTKSRRDEELLRQKGVIPLDIPPENIH
jgi:hypothetical protein